MLLASLAHGSEFSEGSLSKELIGGELTMGKLESHHAWCGLHILSLE